MANSNVRRPTISVTFYGQSLNGAPSGSPLLTVPGRYRTTTTHTTYEPWITGISWAQFSKWFTWGIISQANSAPITVLCCIGGTTDIAVGATGVATYNNLLTIANAARSAGYDYLVNTTLTPSVTITPGALETERLAYNALCIANAGGVFNSVVQVAEDPSLSDYSNTTYYSDGTHWTAAGASVAAGLIVPAIVALTGA